MRGILKFVMVSAVAVSAFASAQDMTAKDMSADATYKTLTKLVGGVWHAGVEKANVESRWQVGPDKLSLVAQTVVGKDSPTPFTMSARFGWDPTAKQVYYLDAHMHDTVYFGHASMDGKDVLIKFSTLVGGESTYIFRCSFTSDDSYKATLYAVDKDKPGKVLEQFTWTRTKE